MAWEVKKLGDVVIIERGGSPRPIQKYLTTSDDGINWIKISDATASDKYIFRTQQKITKDGLFKTRLVKEGDFILSNSMSFGRPYIMKTTGCIHDGWLVLRQKDKPLFETEFLYYLLSSPFIFQQFNYLASGSTVRNLNIALVRSVKVPVPPLPIQKKIVEILDSAFEKIAKAKENSQQNLKNAKEVFESYLQKVFENKGDDWEETKLKDLSNKITDGSHNPPKGVEFSDYLMLSSKNVFNDEINFNNPRYLTKEEFDSENKRTDVNRGDILLTIVGTIGRVAVVLNEEKFTLQRSVAVIKPKNNILNSRYLMFYLQSIFDELTLQARGVAQKGIYLNQLKLFNIAHPKLIEEQKSTVSKLDNLSEQTKQLESIYSQKLSCLEELKQSILQKAFKGELTQEVVV